MSRFLLCGGDFCAFNLGFLADPCNAVHEIACCNRGVGESGFGWHSTAREVCSSLGKRLDGKLVIVTGANGGVGLEAAKSFYEIGATVILACRSPQRAAAAQKLIEASAVPGGGGPPGRLLFLALDLGSLRSVESFAGQVNAMPEPLYALVCNGGVMATPFRLTEDGLEQQFQVNYLSHHHLTMLLVEKLKASAPSRIINVSSISHGWVPFPGGCCGGCCAAAFGGFDLGKRFPAKSGGCCAYEPFEDYSYSKTAQVIMTLEMDRRLLRDSGVVAVALECAPRCAPRPLRRVGHRERLRLPELRGEPHLRGLPGGRRRGQEPAPDGGHGGVRRARGRRARRRLPAQREQGGTGGPCQGSGPRPAALGAQHRGCEKRHGQGAGAAAAGGGDELASGRRGAASTDVLLACILLHKNPHTQTKVRMSAHSLRSDGPGAGGRGGSSCEVRGRGRLVFVQRADGGQRA